MALRHRIAYLRKEHQELGKLADKIETALALSRQSDLASHSRGLKKLRALEHGFAGVVEHCHTDDRIVESTLHHYLNEEERRRVDEEHAQILRTLVEFREELRFATVDRTETMIIPGMNFARLLRSHIAAEEKLLDRIEKSAEIHRKAGAKMKTSRRHTPAARARKKNAQGRSQIPDLPYTLEPHPEF